MSGLIVYNRLFGEDSIATRARARRVMFFIYGLLIFLSAGIVVFIYSTEGAVPPKTWIQATIMLLIGIGGLYTLAKNPAEKNMEAV